MAKSYTGIVSSDKGDKTVVVSVATRRTHPIYKKQYTVNSKFMAHDENNEAKQGDKVLIVETRPISARKRFALEKVLEKAQIRHTETEETVVESPAPVVKPEKPEPKTATKKKVTKKTEVES